MSGDGLIYTSIACYPRLYLFENCNSFQIHEEKEKKKSSKFAFSLGYVPLCRGKKQLSITTPKLMQTFLLYWL